MNQLDIGLDLQILTVGEWQENCYLLVDRTTDQALLIDPGDEPDRILKWLGRHSVQQIVITHAHKDHIGAVNAIRTALALPVFLHPEDRELASAQKVIPDFDLKDNDTIPLGVHTVRIRHAPGHTPGSVILLCASLAIVGDTIFPGGPGHTNKPEELSQSLISLRKTVFSCPDVTTLYPGHGGSTTVGRERPGYNSLISKTLPATLFGDVTWTG